VNSWAEAHGTTVADNTEARRSFFMAVEVWDMED
jgi:hypothetical protein